jgi:predicted nuclease with RNAse H fold
MTQPVQTVVGIDVGGELKGFHAVALRGTKFIEIITEKDPGKIVSWSLKKEAKIVAVDAPCKWSQTGKSRLAERELAKIGINCFATPRREFAQHRDFYQWVFNGEWLYRLLEPHYPLFNGQRSEGRTCIETFPQAVICAMAGNVVSARHKATRRRQALRDRGHDVGGLPNIDFIDAALCAVAAEEFRKGSYQPYGDQAEGFIVVPRGMSKRN